MDANNKDKAVRFLFTDYYRLSSVGGETSLAEMVGALTKTAERNFGVLATRIYRAMKPRTDGRQMSRKVCCLPLWLVSLLFVIDLIAISIVVAVNKGPVQYAQTEEAKQSMYWSFGGVGIFLFVILLVALWPIFYHMAISPYRRVLNAAGNVNRTKGNATYEAFMMRLKIEVEHLAGMVNAFDCVGNHQTRLVVEVNGLDR